MSALVRNYFQNNGFDEVLFLNELPEKPLEEVQTLCPEMPRGWFELSHLKREDRVEFTSDFWMRSFSFHPKGSTSLSSFFALLEDVGPVLFRKGAVWDVEMIYALSQDRCFFRGKVPVKEMDLIEEMGSAEFDLPRDFLSFLRIHGGLGKLSEVGILGLKGMREAKAHLMELILHREDPIETDKGLLNPSFLLPFYEDQGLSSFQCFYADWYPESEMGNVYFSGVDYKISNIRDRIQWTSELAFPTFLHWLAHYLGGMSTSLP